ncbi:MAG: tetratricopeptide repeat protein [Armatimonadota bacterium]|nr:tetratricopeptide repeat protein [bacterium]
MRKCEDCNIILDNDVHFCPKCGKEIQPGEGMPILEVGAYLTSANLHRIRGEWDEAVNDATEALRLDPKNADIASLLGTIYQERGMLEDSVIWFQMALEMNPASTSDRARLNDVKARIASARQHPGSRDRFRTIEKRTRMWAIGMAALFVVVVVLALIFAAGKRNQDDVTKSVSLDRGVRQAAPVSTNEPFAPPMPSSGTASQQTTRSRSSDATSLAGGSSSRTPAEVKIRQDVSEAEGIGSAKIDDVIADPRQKIAVVTYSIPDSTLTKSAVISAAEAVARAAFASNQEVKFVTARCIVTHTGSSSTQIAFVGDISRQAVQALGTNATADQIEASFTGLWWNPQIK